MGGVCQTALWRSGKGLDYLGRYTPGVAIPNHGLKERKQGQVTFAYKDYEHQAQQKEMTLSADEFLRRFLLHVLPYGSQRIRHYGLLSNRHRAKNLARCRELLAMPEPVRQLPGDYRERCQQLSGYDPLLCPQCRSGRMVRMGFVFAVNLVPRCDSSLPWELPSMFL